MIQRTSTALTRLSRAVLIASLAALALTLPNPISGTRVAHAAAPTFGNNNGTVPHDGMEISWMQANNATRLGVLPEPSAFTVTATVGTETKNIQVVSVTLTSGYLLDLILATAITSGAVV